MLDLSITNRHGCHATERRPSYYILTSTLRDLAITFLLPKCPVLGGPDKLISQAKRGKRKKSGKPGGNRIRAARLELHKRGSIKVGLYAFMRWYWDLDAWRAISGPDVIKPVRYGRDHEIVKWAIYNWNETGPYG